MHNRNKTGMGCSGQKRGAVLDQPLVCFVYLVDHPYLGVPNFDNGWLMLKPIWHIITDDNG